jgi:TPR repeat protein
LGEPVLAGEDPDDLVIAEGGAAATAYSRLQFEDIKSDTRHKINQALLRYCELDTLAMVMIVQGWRDLLGSPPLSSHLNLTEKPSDVMTYFDYGSNLFDTANCSLEIDTAVMWITKAAELGYATAQNKLGHLFSFSAKLGIDYERARFWMSASAGQGDAQGQTLLGIYYDNGFDDHADKARAIELYKAASAQGWAQAQYNLGWCYLNGNGVEVNIEKGRYFYQLAAEQNYRRAVVALAELDRATMKQVSL